MRIRALDSHEVEEMTEFRDLGNYLLDYYQFDEAGSPDLLDRLYEAWRDDAGEKAPPVAIAHAIGVLLGDILADRLCFDWCMVTDEERTAFCLKSAENGWEAYPIVFVWKRVMPGAETETAFCVAAWELFRDKVPARATAA